MRIETKKESFKESFEETDSIEIIFLFFSCFKDESILLMNNRVTIKRWDDTLFSESKWGQKRLWEDKKDIGKLIIADKDKNRDKGEIRDIKGKNLSSKVFMIKR